MATISPTVSTAVLFDLTEDEQKALIAFKKELNEKLPALLPELKDWLDDDGKLVHENAELFDAGFENVVYQFVLDDDKVKATTGLEDIRQKFDNLPPAIRNPLEINRVLFERPGSATATKDQQAQAVINYAQDFLGVDSTENGEVDINTADALKERLKVLKSENPDIGVDFTPQSLDRRTVEFLKALAQKRMGEAGLKSDNLNFEIIHIIELQKEGKLASGGTSRLLGETFSLGYLTDLLVNGALPSGVATIRPNMDAPWDKKWTNDSAPDRFFSPQTYAALKDQSSVPTATLFMNSPANPNAAMLKEIAKDIGIDPRKESFTLQEVGKLAAEVLARKAAELGIEENDVNKAIHSGRYMPHLEDLLIVEKGFLGSGSTKQEQSEYESSQFAQRFGTIDQAFLDSLPANDTLHYPPFKPEIHQSPASYFRVFRGVTGSTKLTPYEQLRQDGYLPRYAEYTVDGDKSRFATSGEKADQPEEKEPDTDHSSDEIPTVEEVLRRHGYKFPELDEPLSFNANPQATPDSPLVASFRGSSDLSDDFVADNIAGVTGQEPGETPELELVEGSAGFTLKTPGTAA